MVASPAASIHRPLRGSPPTPLAHASAVLEQQASSPLKPATTNIKSTKCAPSTPVGAAQINKPAAAVAAAADNHRHGPTTADVAAVSAATTSTAATASADSNIKTVADVLGPAGTRCIYEKVRLLGSGAYGEAWLAKRRVDGAIFVVKALDTAKMSRRDQKYAETEIQCMAACDHFAVIGYEAHHVVGTAVLIVMEFADAGDLNMQIKARSRDPTGGRHFEEHEVGYALLQLCLALDHVHRQHMLHRDIKGANILLASNGLVKLGDFGFSQQYSESVSGDVAVTFCGTPYYLAPELWKRQKYSKKADIWSLGILLYEMMALKRPFTGRSQKELMHMIVSSKDAPPPPLPAPAAQKYSAELLALYHAMLQHDPACRPSAAELLRSPYLQRAAAHFEQSATASTVVSAEAKALIRRNLAESRDAPASPTSSCRSKRRAPSCSSSSTPQRVSATADGCGPSSPPVLAAVGECNTAVSHEGPIRKESGGVWKQRHFKLADGKLVIAVRRGDADTRSVDVAVLGSVTPVPLKLAKAEGVFALNTLDNKTMWMQAPSKAECDVWVSRIQQAMGIA